MDSTVLFPNFSTKWTTSLCYYKMVMLWPTEHKQDHKNTNKWASVFRNDVVPNELPSFQSYTLTGLNTYTQYLVSLKAYNPAGDGPETIVVVMTDEGGKKLSLNKNEIIDGDIELGSFWLNSGSLIRHSYKCVERSLQYIYASLKKLLAHRKYIEHVARNYSEKRSGRRRSVSRPSLFLFTTED